MNEARSPLNATIDALIRSAMERRDTVVEELLAEDGSIKEVVERLLGSMKTEAAQDPSRDGLS